MARARAAENPRSRPKAVLIEEMTRGIGKFQEVLSAIDDFSQEGFPYRVAAQAKAELQFRECVRRVFGDRSPEFQTYRNYRLRTSNKSEVAQSIAVVKSLMQTLEDKKLELQGLKPPPATDSQPESNLPAPLTLVPPSAQITLTPQPAPITPPMTVSIAMATNLGPSTAPAPTMLPPVPPVPEPQANAPSHAPAMSPSPPVDPAPPPRASNVPVTHATPSLREEPATATASAPKATPPPPPATVSHEGSPASAQPPSDEIPTPSPPPRSKVRQTSAGSRVEEPAMRSETQPPSSHPSAPSSSGPDEPARGQAALGGRSSHQPNSDQEPIQLIRKVCLRFHTVVRQLRLRKDYRATLEVEDEYDLQDLLHALLRMEFDEVTAEEWTPSYTGGAPRTTLFVNRDQIAVVAKKTRSGLSAKELADQVAADSAYYRAQDRCATLFCFIYDPEGRIGSPKRLETNLTSVSERCTVEVLVAPK